MQLVTLLWLCGVVFVIVMLAGIVYCGWYIWTHFVSRSLHRRALYDIYHAVTTHLEQRCNLARPQDKPGSDPDTKQLVFRRQSADTVIIARIDWNGPFEKHYAITVTNQGVYCNYYLATTGSSKVRPTAADKRWVKRPMTLGRVRYLRKAVDGRHYILARARQRDDTPVESISL